MATKKQPDTKPLEKLKKAASPGSTVGTLRDRKKTLDKKLDELGAKASTGKGKTRLA